MLKSGQTWAGVFSTLDATGALATPSVGPTGTLYIDGSSDSATVTITGSNPYKFSVTLPSLTAGQRVDMYITATISSIATAGIVASDQADTAYISNVKSDTADILADTGTDGVLISSGTGAKQLNLASGAVLLQPTQTGVTIPTVTNLTNLPTMPTDWITAAGIKADAVTEIQSGLATAAALATVSGYVDDLEARLTAARAGYLDKLNVTGTLANTDNADTFKADVSGLATEAALAIVSGYVDELESRLTAIRAGYLDKLGVTGVLANTDNADVFSEEILNSLVEGVLTLKETLRVMLAVLAGRSDGGGTGTIKFKDLGGTFDRITATVDVVGNRTNVVLDGSDTGI